MKFRKSLSELSIKLSVFLTLSAASAALAASSAPLPSLNLSWSSTVKSKDSLVLAVKVALPAGWYINSNAPLDSFLVATLLEVSAPGLEFDAPRYPQPVVEHSQAMGGNMSLFKGPFEIAVTARGIKSGKQRAALPKALPPTRVTLHYQSCDGTMCWPPKAVSAILQEGITRKE